MSGNGRLGGELEGREGDQAPDTYQGDFAVFEGDHSKLESQQTDTYLDELDRYVQDTMGGFGSGKLNHGISKTPLDDLMMHDEDTDA